MSGFKVYLKRGSLNYKERRLVNAITKAIEQNPDIASGFTPARNFDELKALHDKYCVTDVNFEEVGAGGENTNSEKGNEEITETTNEAEDDGKKENDSTVDPFNREAPEVRDYVQGGGLNDSAKQNDVNTGQTNFEEPTDIKGAFEMPSTEDEKGTGTHSQKKKPKAETNPVNPSFNDMDNGKKKRSTKRFAKIIVEAVCLLAEKGCIWWTTKDITEDKLIQYEIEDTMDLQILLTLEDNQQATVKEWFGSKVNEAQTLFKVDPKDKEDLIESLYEVMLEKGIAPTPMQELIINSVKTFVLDMGLKAFALSQQINGVIAQLKSLKHEGKKANPNTDDDGGGVQENPATKDKGNGEGTQETGLTPQE